MDWLLELIRTYGVQGLILGLTLLASLAVMSTRLSQRSASAITSGTPGRQASSDKNKNAARARQVAAVELMKTISSNEALGCLRSVLSSGTLEDAQFSSLLNTAMKRQLHQVLNELLRSDPARARQLIPTNTDIRNTIHALPLPDDRLSLVRTLFNECRLSPDDIHKLGFTLKNAGITTLPVYHIAEDGEAPSNSGYLLQDLTDYYAGFRNAKMAMLSSEQTSTAYQLGAQDREQSRSPRLPEAPKLQFDRALQAAQAAEEMKRQEAQRLAAEKQKKKRSPFTRRRHNSELG